MKYRILAVLFLVVSAVSAEDVLKQAEKSSGEKAFQLDEVVVTGTKTEKYLRDEPGSVELVPAEKVKESSNAGEATADLSGVDVGHTGVLGQTQNVFIRGVAAEGTLILLDGIPLNGSYSGLVDFSSLLLDNIERIEVMKGPASSLYGANAVGGVINLITKTKADKPEMTFGGKYGTFNTQEYNLGFSGKFDQLMVNVGGSYQHTDGERVNSAFNSVNTNGKVTYVSPKGSMISLSAGYYKDDVGAPGSTGFPTPTDKQYDLKVFSNLETKIVMSDDMNLKVNLYTGKKGMNFYSSSTTTSTEDNYIADAQYTYDLAGINVLTFGTTYKYDAVNQNSIGMKDASTKSLYAQDVIDLLGAFIFTPSVRYDSHSTYGDSLNPQASLVYNFDDGIQFKGSVGSSFRAPTFSDLYWPVDNVYFTKGNSALVPEKAVSFDAGLSYEAPGVLFARATYFENDIKDMIQWTFDSTSFYFMPLNIGNAKMYGVESEVKVHPVENAEVSVNYTWMSAKDTGTDKDLYYRPRNRVNLGLKYGVSIFKLELNSEYYDNRIGPDAVTYLDVTLPAVIVSNAKITAKVTDFSELFAGVSNLENVAFELRSGYPMPGRTFNAGANFKF